MGCQRAIAQKINDKKAHYIIALKGIRERCTKTSSFSWPSRRPGTLRTRLSPARRRSTAIMAASETRKYTLIHDVACLKQRHDWPGLSGRRGVPALLRHLGFGASPFRRCPGWDLLCTGRSRCGRARSAPGIHRRGRPCPRPNAGCFRWPQWSRAIGPTVSAGKLSDVT